MEIIKRPSFKHGFKQKEEICISGCYRKYGDEGCPSDCNYCGHY